MVILNTILWVTGNLVVLVIFLSALAFAVLYPVLFDWKEWTTGGRLVWRAILSLALLGGLVSLGIFVDSDVHWWQMPDHVLPWRPAFRLIVYGFIAYTYASLVVLLVIRRFWPAKLKTAPQDWTLPKSR